MMAIGYGIFTLTVLIALFEYGYSTFCEENILFYQDILCTPVYKTPSDVCPHHFNCTVFEKKNKEKCYFRGDIYNVGEKIDNPITEANCLSNCNCISSEDGAADVKCAEITCPEANAKPKEGCQYKYDILKCCAVGQICPKEEKAIYCDVGGNKILEGTRYTSLEAQETCVCAKDLKGQPSQRCLKISCLFGIKYKKQVEKFCAPVYTSRVDLCPSSMYCPSSKLQADHNTTLLSSKCRFGARYWNIGDAFLEFTPEYTLECICTIPPFVTCTEMEGIIEPMKGDGSQAPTS